MSQTAADLERAANIDNLRKIGSFDAGPNGRLPIWQIRSKAYDCLLVLIVHNHVDVDICLKGNDATDLNKYLPDLEKLAESVYFIRNTPNPAPTP